VGISAATKRLKGHIECTTVPYFTSIDLNRLGHSAIHDHLVEFARTDSDVLGCCLAS